MTGTTLVEKIDHVLKLNNSKRQELADYCGITAQAISDWYKKGSTPSMTLGIKIAEFLGVSIDWLYQDEYENNWDSFVDLEGLGKVNLSPREIMLRIRNQLESTTHMNPHELDENFYADILDIMPYKQIQAFFANRNEPTLRQLQQVALRIKLPVEYLLTGQFTTDVNNPDSFTYSLAQQYKKFIIPLNCLHADEQEIVRLIIEKFYMNRVTIRDALFDKGIDIKEIPGLN